jgi:hypothetical protein
MDQNSDMIGTWPVLERISLGLEIQYIARSFRLSIDITNFFVFMYQTQNNNGSGHPIFGFW